MARPPLQKRLTPDLLAAYPWVGAEDTAYQTYMAREWGVPVHEDTKLFEMLTLEIFQAGLSWATILKRRAGFKKAFARWNIKKVAKYGDDDRARLLADESIIRNARKIDAAIHNAGCCLKLQSACGSLDTYFWDFVGGTPIRRHARLRDWSKLPAQTKESVALANDLKSRGFKFVGPVSIYAFMQAVGLIDDRLHIR